MWSQLLYFTMSLFLSSIFHVNSFWAQYLHSSSDDKASLNTPLRKIPLQDFKKGVVHPGTVGTKTFTVTKICRNGDSPCAGKTLFPECTLVNAKEPCGKAGDECLRWDWRGAR